MQDYKVNDFRKDMWNGFKQYYVYYLYSGGCDPAYDVLNYISEKENLSLEDRYSLSLLYGSCYNDATAYTMLERFPKDLINTDKNTLLEIWKQHKQNLLFTSDRQKMKNFDEIPNIISSYQSLLNGSTQEEFFNTFITKNLSPEKRYSMVYEFADKIRCFGRFSLFNYLETLNELTPLQVYPDTINLEEAESARNGLCYACNKPEQVTLHHKEPLEKIDYPYLKKRLSQLKYELKKENPEINVNYFNIETSLCGYKKLFWRTRYLGYYIDRHGAGTKWMEQHNPDISYNHIWEMRNKYLTPYFNNTYIDENRCNLMMETGKLFKRQTLIDIFDIPVFTYQNLMPHLRNKEFYQKLGDSN